MLEQEFQEQVLREFTKLNGQIGSLEGRFGKFEGKVDRISEDLTDFKSNQEKFNESISTEIHEFKGNQEKFNDSIWNLNTQAFKAINEIRSEVVAPWKLRKNA